MLKLSQLVKSTLDATELLDTTELLDSIELLVVTTDDSDEATTDDTVDEDTAELEGVTAAEDGVLPPPPPPPPPQAVNTAEIARVNPKVDLFISTSLSRYNYWFFCVPAEMEKRPG